MDTLNNQNIDILKPAEPDKKRKTTAKKPAQNEAGSITRNESEAERFSHPLIELTSDQMVQGIILSEILGKPVSKRHGLGRVK